MSFEVEIDMKKYRPYRRKSVQLMRPYVAGERMDAIEVPKGITPEEGGMIVVDPTNTEDKRYIAPTMFTDDYEEV